MDALSEFTGRMRALRCVQDVTMVNIPALKKLILRFAFVDVSELEMENASLLESYKELGELKRKQDEEKERRRREEKKRREEERRRKEEGRGGEEAKGGGREKENGGREEEERRRGEEEKGTGIEGEEGAKREGNCVECGGLGESVCGAEVD